MDVDKLNILLKKEFPFVKFLIIEDDNFINYCIYSDYYALFWYYKDDKTWSGYDDLIEYIILDKNLNYLWKWLIKYYII